MLCSLRLAVIALWPSPITLFNNAGAASRQCLSVDVILWQKLCLILQHWTMVSLLCSQCTGHSGRFSAVAEHSVLHALHVVCEQALHFS